ncbi:MAG: UDP-N-acetylglucosamine 1-carboxyvinyltransferase [Clostridia bacterium]|nr:UDP-N-acetylglucosamine 1-carboxyvinyltransferase [Clostridia bacterium]
MDKIIINGPCRLEGEVDIAGAKNAIVAILPAAMLVDGVCRIENIPHISDVENICNILIAMGAIVRRPGEKTLEVDCSGVRSTEVPYEYARKFRASYYFLGALLGRFGEASVALPGGCHLGARPIDQHIKAFEQLGAAVDVVHGNVNCHAEKLIGSDIYLDMVSVGATINAMLAATKAEGLTVIENVAKEPHIVDVANFLNSMGANIRGAGTDVIKVQGVPRLIGGSYAVIPDQIEAGTYMAAAAATGGKVLVKNIIPKHMESITAKLEEMGVSITEYDDSILVDATEPLKKTNIKTMPYPGFPTDMQPQMATVMLRAEGISKINEGIWDSRFKYTDELIRMGAEISVAGKIATIEGGKQLMGAPVRACDLRAGAAMVIAGLMAKGTTTIEDIEHIRRGYERIIEKLAAMGADIRLIIE